MLPAATRSSYRNSLRVLKYSFDTGSGMIPRRYAPSTLSGLRSAQNATGPSAEAAPGRAAAGKANDSQSGKRLAGMGWQVPVRRAQVSRCHQVVDVAVKKLTVGG